MVGRVYAVVTPFRFGSELSKVEKVVPRMRTRAESLRQGKPAISQTPCKGVPWVGFGAVVGMVRACQDDPVLARSGGELKPLKPFETIVSNNCPENLYFF